MWLSAFLLTLLLIAITGCALPRSYPRARLGLLTGAEAVAGGVQLVLMEPELRRSAAAAKVLMALAVATFVVVLVIALSIPYRGWLGPSASRWLARGCLAGLAALVPIGGGAGAAESGDLIVRAVQVAPWFVVLAAVLGFQVEAGAQLRRLQAVWARHALRGAAALVLGTFLLAAGFPAVATWLVVLLAAGLEAMLVPIRVRGLRGDSPSGVVAAWFCEAAVTLVLLAALIVIVGFFALVL